MGGNGEQEEAEDGKRDNKDVGAYLVGGEDECPNTKRTPFEEQEVKSTGRRTGTMYIFSRCHEIMMHERTDRYQPHKSQ